jgi:hypothetical protein
MKWWLVGSIAGLCVLAFALAIAIVFVQERQRVQTASQGTRKASKAQVSVKTAAQKAAEEPPNPALASFPSAEKTYTWSEAQKEMDRLRQMRKENPVAMEVLSSWHDYLADPKFTESRDDSEHVARLESLLAEHPQASDLLVALAHTHLKSAWDARGTLTDEYVTDEGRRVMRERAAKAKELLEQAIELGVKDGQAHALLVDIARIGAAPLAEARALFEAGRKIDPHFHDLYIAMAEYLLPRWHGQPGDVERFAAEMAQALPGDEGLDVYIHIAYAANQYDSNLLFWGEYDRGLLAKGADVVRKRYAHTRNLLPFAALATIAAQDHAAARRIRPVLKHDNAPRVWIWQSVAAEFNRWADSRDVAAGQSTWVWGAPLNYPPLIFAPDSQSVWCPSGLGPLAAVQWDLTGKRAKTAFTATGSRITQMAFDPKKNWLVAAVTTSDKPRWLLWDTTQPDAEPFEHPTSGPCEALAIHPDLPQVAFAVDDRVLLFDMATKAETPLIQASDPVTALRFSADGKSLVVSDSSFTICNVPSGEKRYVLAGAGGAHNAEFACEKILDFDDDGRVWATGFVPGSNPTGRSLVRFAADGKSHEVISEKLLTHVVVQPLTAVLSPDRRRLAIAEQPKAPGGPEPIFVLDLASGKVQEFIGHTEHIGEMAFSPDGRRLASVNHVGGTLRLWPLAK